MDKSSLSFLNLLKPFVDQWNFPQSLIQFSQYCPLIILRGHRLYFPNNIVFLSLKIKFVLANSAYPDAMLHSTTLHLGLHCLQNNL